MTRTATLLLCLLLCCTAGCAVKPVIPPSAALDPQPYAMEVRAVLRHGDWLITRGVHATDNVVASVTRMPFSHASIYDAERDEVIEADGSGIHTTPFADLLAKSQRVLVIRPMWSTEGSAPVAVERARALLGKGYNFTGLVGVDSPDRYYCTQVCMEAYRPFMTAEKPDNPIPKIIAPGNMYFWGRILYDSGP